MDFLAKVFTKSMRLRKDVADDYRSMRRFYEGSPEEFIHEAIAYSKENAPLVTHIKSIVNGGRLTGVNVGIRIPADDWLELQAWREETLAQLKLAQKKLSDEDELLQVAICCYAKVHKSRKGMS